MEIGVGVGVPYREQRQPIITVIRGCKDGVLTSARNSGIILADAIASDFGFSVGPRPLRIHPRRPSTSRSLAVHFLAEADPPLFLSLLGHSSEQTPLSNSFPDHLPKHLHTKHVSINTTISVATFPPTTVCSLHARQLPLTTPRDLPQATPPELP